MNRPNRAHFDQICRLCLNTSSLVNIFEKNSRTQKESLSLLVRETVEMLGQLIEPDDGFPKKICLPCKDFLRQLYKFRNQCQEASDLLAEAFSAPEMVQNVPSPPATAEVQQQEPPLNQPSPKPQIQIVPPLGILKQEYIAQPPPAPPSTNLDPDEPDAPTLTTLEKFDPTPEADSSSSCQPSTNVKVEIIQSQENTEYLDTAESYTEEYEYLEAEAETIEEEIEMQVEMQEESTADAQRDSVMEEHSFEVFVEDGTETATEGESDDITDTHSASASSKHTSNKGQMCKICGKYSTCLKYHLMCHTGERPFPCDFCDKTFRTSTKLNVHVNGVHLKVRKYTCEICNKKFLDSGNLRNHKVTHGGERKYICDFEGCGKTFALQGTLTVHKKSHIQDKRFTCDFCLKNFLYKWLLVKHLRTHTGEKPYECDICHKKFSTSTHMHTHKKTHDPDRENHGKKRKTRASKSVLAQQDDSDTSELVSEN
ncbi:zinc finger protein 184-like [Ochlerotatus camptorhynchus]|uniref:zinc finger protein 184-like n=1 Tax=Ochlerotatus camptorhynchus TaxID=644619 RepID=UPI0031D998B3